LPIISQREKWRISNDMLQGHKKDNIEMTNDTGLFKKMFGTFELTGSLTSIWINLGCFDKVQKTKSPENQ